LVSATVNEKLEDLLKKIIQNKSSDEPKEIDEKEQKLD